MRSTAVTRTLGCLSEASADVTLLPQHRSTTCQLPPSRRPGTAASAAPSAPMLSLSSLRICFMLLSWWYGGSSIALSVPSLNSSASTWFSSSPRRARSSQNFSFGRDSSRSPQQAQRPIPLATSRATSRSAASSIIATTCASQKCSLAYSAAVRLLSLLRDAPSQSLLSISRRVSASSWPRHWRIPMSMSAVQPPRFFLASCSFGRLLISS
mmetsp:Transcript_15276/g.52209  ORF Transcript_15276/g.52209 Transcript_15276/m.52209 type:complete len:211 (+) Transcript_15276:1417-2049(+)